MSKLIQDTLERLSTSHDNARIWDDSQGRWFTHNELLVRTGQLATWLGKEHVQKGERVLVAGSNTFAFVTAYLGVILSGRVAVPVHADATQHEWSRLMEQSEAKAAVVTVDTENGDALCREASMHHLPYIRVGADGVLLGCPLMATSKNSGFAYEIDDEAAAVMLFTSGTTGRPKGVTLSHRIMRANADNVIRSHALTDADTAYCFLPLFHINAQVVVLWSTLLSGGQLILQRKFSARRFWSTIAANQITWVSAVPAIITILLQTSGPVSTTTLRFVRSASAPLPANTLRQFEQRFGIPVIESYGMTEAASQICVNPLPPQPRKAGSVGLPYGVELKVVNDQFETLPPNETGEIALRGQSVISEYAGGAGADSFVDGWFLTGDIGYRDNDGYVYLVARKKELINRAGEKVSPREIEEVLLTHANVKQAAVIGVPDAVLGERIVAYVTVHQAMLVSDMRESLNKICLELLSKFKRPSEICIVEQLPTGATGKIQRLRLRQEILKQQDTEKNVHTISST
ncbi:AMP-binding protein [Alicyclobacillus fodiniaquatilis]|jgi:acyl-CoA synthetase (AMP-forming)/AMP-acid ligase II|uniref:AMP-binding protein n=1 Tax=Alicyclobacillus fodiniaquatilis TaxID=1661150 RepID=A0ABW4JDQ1_9BACL